MSIFTMTWLVALIPDAAKCHPERLLVFYFCRSRRRTGHPPAVVANVSAESFQQGIAPRYVALVTDADDAAGGFYQPRLACLGWWRTAIVVTSIALGLGERVQAVGQTVQFPLPSES